MSETKDGNHEPTKPELETSPGNSESSSADEDRITEPAGLICPSDIVAGHHRLQYSYGLWYSKRSPGKLTTTQTYDQNLKFLGKFNSVEQFWSIYSHLMPCGELQGHSDYHLFKTGIKPMWEDYYNRFGGKWIVRVKKGLSSRLWENLILAILGEQFMVGSEICGAVVSVRFQEDIVSIWNKSADDITTTTRIRDTLKRVLNLPYQTIMEYKTHNDSLKDHSSFRNTDVFLR